MFDGRVRTRKQETDMTVIGPLDKVWGLSVLSMDFDDPSISIRLSIVVALDDEPISYSCLHRSISS
jgi:hypothetical protein